MNNNVKQKNYDVIRWCTQRWEEKNYRKWISNKMYNMINKFGLNVISTNKNKLDTLLVCLACAPKTYQQ